jgi:hypothetical protein
MGDSNCRGSRMVAYQQEVRRLEEKFDGFELHHILRLDNEAADALAHLGSSRESPPLGVFAQDLFKPSIQLEEDTPSLAPGASLSEGGLVFGPGPYQGKAASHQNRGLVPKPPLSLLRPSRDMQGS